MGFFDLLSAIQRASSALKLFIHQVIEHFHYQNFDRIKEDDINQTLFEVGGSSTKIMIKPKQIWSLINGTRTLKFVFIQKYCPESGDQFVHISILDENFDPTIGHAPFAISAVVSSVDQLIEENSKLSISEEGFLIWQKEHVEGTAGYYDILIQEAIM